MSQSKEHLSEDGEYLSEEFLQEQSVYQMLVYMPLDKLTLEKGDMVTDILDKIEEEDIEIGAFEQDLIRAIEAIIADNPDLGNSIIDDLSWADKDGDEKPDHPYNGMVASTFTNQDGEVFVTFRGTPGGSWIDNAKMVMGILRNCRTTKDINGNEWNYFSPMQAEALEYMNGLLDSYGETWLENGKQYMVGHSKGGNPVQFLMLMYSEYFEAGLSVDGPGFSKESYQELVDNLGEEAVEEALKKLYGLHGSNDFVHPLGYQLILLQNTRWAKEYTDYAGYIPIAGSHFLNVLVNPETGKMVFFADGPGPMANFIRRVSERAMELPPDEREAMFMTVMLILQLGYAGQLPVNPDEERWFGTVGNLDNGMGQALGIILSILLLEKEGAALIAFLQEEGIIDTIKKAIDDLMEWYSGLPATMQQQVALGVVLLFIVGTILAGTASGLMDHAEMVQNLLDLGEMLIQYGTLLVGIFMQTIKDVISAYIKESKRIKKKLKADVETIVEYYAWEPEAQEGKVGVNYDNVSATIDLIGENNTLLYRDVISKIEDALDSLKRMKYWKVSTESLLSCIDTMEKLDWNLGEYCRRIGVHALGMQKLEGDFIKDLNKT